MTQQNGAQSCQPLGRLEMVGSAILPGSSTFDDSAVDRLGVEERLGEFAAGHYRIRQRRARYFDCQLLSEPAWDMLLDLFVNKTAGKRVSTLSLCLAARSPAATGLRWIARLEQQGLAARHRAPDDRRLVLVEITSRGYRAMWDYMSDEIARANLPG